MCYVGYFGMMIRRLINAMYDERFIDDRCLTRLSCMTWKSMRRDKSNLSLGKTLLVVDMFRRLLRQQALRTVWSAGRGAFRGLLASPSKMRGPQITVTDSVGLFGLVCQQDQFKFMNSELQKQADLLLSKWHQSAAARTKDMISCLRKMSGKNLNDWGLRMNGFLSLNFGVAIAAGRVAAWIALSGCQMIWMVLQWSPF